MSIWSRVKGGSEEEEEEGEKQREQRKEKDGGWFAHVESMRHGGQLTFCKRSR